MIPLWVAADQLKNYITPRIHDTVLLFFHLSTCSTKKSTMNKTIGIDLKVKDLSEWMEMIVQAHSCGIHNKPS